MFKVATYTALNTMREAKIGGRTAVRITETFYDYEKCCVIIIFNIYNFTRTNAKVPKSGEAQSTDSILV